ncbi:formyl-CoA transferase [Chromatiales bacterium (ex Bugula neritina AB1)]|nr:formyl-CoA transferase [Chromatiales bacterium (ex Bugula neritina AB1)]
MQFLQNIRVIEFSHMVMGPSVGMILGDLGAEVIKIEPIGGDKTRSLPGSGAGYFAMFNRNKKSICLDIKTEEGRQVIRDLLASADVMIENFRPGALDKLGFGYDDAKKINPGIIYQSSKGFLSGPYEQRTALDEVAQMMGGLAYMTGPPGRPLRAGSSVIDITGGMFGVIGILSALLSRTQTSEGAQVTSALFETTVFLVGQHMAQHAVTGIPAAPMPARTSAWAVYDVFETADAQMFVGVVSDGQWQRFCEVFKLTHWHDNDKYRKNKDRVILRDEIIPYLKTLFIALSNDALEARLTEAGLPFAPISKPEELKDNPHLQHNGLHSIKLPEPDPQEPDKSVLLPKLPVEINGQRATLNQHPPTAGGNTGTVLSELGYDDKKIQSLINSGIVA